MINKNPQDQFPQIDSSAYVDSTAIILGNVKIGKNVFIGPLTVIRADELNSFIEIQDNSNVQDRVTIHSLENSDVVVKENTSLSHGCIVHGPCVIGNHCFVGFGALVFKSSIADNVFIKNRAVVDNVNISENSIVDTADVIKEEKDLLKLKSLDDKSKDFMDNVVRANLSLVKGYKK